MEHLAAFAHSIKSVMERTPIMDVVGAREIVRLVNEFLYTTHEGIGKIEALGQTFDFFSEFHKFWHNHYEEILDCRINDESCRKVAIALHDIYVLTNGNAYQEVWDTYGLTPEDTCRVRLFTANQDFRGSLDFKNLSDAFNADPSSFDENVIIENPDNFISSIGLNDKSQTDKRTRYAKNIASFVKNHSSSPIDIIKSFGNDVSAFRKALIDSNSGYGYKKADMFIRDMVVLGIWPRVCGFDAIDVASDVNTMKVALRTGIITTAIPLVSSFIDIFCYQYGYIETMNARAWRRVWEIWCEMFPNESLLSPCLLDYFVYKVIGKQFCGNYLAVFKCDEQDHVFRWHSGRNKTCQVCYKRGRRNVKAHVVAKVCPCCDAEGEVAILQSEFVKSLPQDKKIRTCPFSAICSEYKYLNPPKSISIKGQTGWETAYAIKGEGGGGLMA